MTRCWKGKVDYRLTDKTNTSYIELSQRNLGSVQCTLGERVPRVLCNPLGSLNKFIQKCIIDGFLDENARPCRAHLA